MGRSGSILVNLLTLMVLGATALVGLTFLLILINPALPINPFPPPTVPSIAVLPSPTPTSLVPTFPPTFTPTATMTSTPSKSARIAILSEIVNIVEARAAEAEAFTPASDGLVLDVGSHVRTGDASRVRLDFSEGTIVRAAQNSSFAVQVLGASQENPVTRLVLEAGKLWVSLADGTLEVETPIGVAAVHGSFAVFEYNPSDPNDPNDDVLVIDCIEGTCSVQNQTVNETTGNLEQIALSNGGDEVTRAVLADENVQEFVSNNPEVGQAIAASLTAAPSANVLLTDTATPAPDITETVTETEAPTESTPTETPTVTATPTDTPSGPAPTPSKTRSAFPFTVQGNGPLPVQNFANSAGCNWMGVAGQAFDLNGIPIVGYIVHLEGGGLDADSITGSKTAYGSGGYEFFLNDHVVQTTGEYKVQLLNPSGTPVSDFVVVNTFADCSKNLLLVNFVQNH